MFGYTGKLLFVNLSESSFEVKELEESLARDFLGGYGLGARILYEEMPAQTPAFAPESMIGFISSPLNGARAFFGGRYTIVSKSPVYNGWNDSNSGGFFGPMLKRSGYDAVFVKGIAETPVYIFINNGDVEIRSAAHLWGKTVSQTEESLATELGGKKINAAIIGPGGENLSYMSGVFNDGHRAAARGGSGAIMGSKKLKALVVCGTHTVEVADKEKLLGYSKLIADNINGPKAAVKQNIGRFGTGQNLVSNVFTADASIKNWLGSGVADFSEEKCEKISKSSFDDKYKVKKFSCSSCPIGCGAIYKVEEGKWPITHTGRLEYETIGGFGSQMLNDDIHSIIWCNEMCNQAGLDTVSVAGTIAWAMECYESGILAKEDLDGIELTWGNADSIVEVVRKICDNEGNCAALMRNGSQFAANSIGKGHECLVVASGMELPQHDARNSPGYGRSYLFDPTPGRHVKGGIGVREKAAPPEVRYNFRDTGFRDAIGTSIDEIVAAAGYCRFYGMAMSDSLRMPVIEAVTGFHYTRLEEHLLGLRIFFMRLAFNIREGITRKDYTLSDRMRGFPPLETGILAGVTLDIDLMVDNFLNAIGCNMDGIPHKEVLKMIGGLDFVIKDIYSPEKKN